MENQERRISLEECIDIVAYAIGTKIAYDLKRHLSKYGDWGRIKQVMIAEMIRRNGEKTRTENRLREELIKNQRNLNIVRVL